MPQILVFNGKPEQEVEDRFAPGMQFLRGCMTVFCISYVMVYGITIAIKQPHDRCSFGGQIMV